MKFVLPFAAAITAIALALTSFHAEAAKRMGSGRSVGQQSQNVTQKQATQAQTAPTPAAQNQGTPAKPAATQTPAASPTPTPAAPKPWGAMLGGLAAGLGLAWLAHSMGLGDALGGAVGNILLLMLMTGAALLAWSAYKRYKTREQASRLQPVYSKDYNPNHIGNDSAARPFERSVFTDQPTAQPSAPQPNTQAQSGSMIGSALGESVATHAANPLNGAQNWGIPVGFDTAGFLAGAKTHFVNLQAAWAKGDLTTLQLMLTPEMMIEIRAEILQRDPSLTSAIALPPPEVISIDASLLGIEEIPASAHAAQYMASVEFSGTIREEAGVAPVPFREVWNLTKPVSGGGWMVAGIQALD